MPNNLSLKKILAFLLLVAFVTGYLSFGEISETSSFSSEGIHTHHTDEKMKMISLKPSNEILTRTSKLLPTFKVSISQLATDPIKLEEPFEIVGTIDNDSLAGRFFYEWIIPPGLSLISSSRLSGEVISKKGEVIQLPMTFIQTLGENSNKEDVTSPNSLPNLKIHLRVKSIGTSSEQRTTAQFNTAKQQEIDAEKEELARRHVDYLIENNSREIQLRRSSEGSKEARQ